MKKTYAVKQSYREGMFQVIDDMLGEIGIAIGSRPVQYHLDGTVTVNVVETELERMRAELDGLVEYTGHSNSGNVRISTPETDAFFEANPPTLTDAERAARKAKSGKGGGVSKEEAAQRKALLAERKARLLNTHGIDLDAPADESDEDFDGDE